jgi:uncharacterized protein with HEPN domain
MSKRDCRLLLEDILESCEKILSYTEGFTLNTFMNDEKTIDAVVRNFEIIGEAANRLPESFCNNNPEIPWHQLIGMRNRLIHAYFGIDYEIVWNVIINDIPFFTKQIKIIINKIY